MEVLEAGCGSGSRFRFDQARVTGIDISPLQLARNYALDERICGDLQSHPIRKNAFDLVVCWDVLEHLPRPSEAIHNMIRSLRPGGVIILGLPNLASFKGLITKFTPHGFHMWAYRTLWRSAKAGREDHGPFRTYLRRELLPGRLRAFLEDLGCEIGYIGQYESGMQLQLRRQHILVDRVLAAGGYLVSVISRRKIAPNLTDMILIARRGGTRDEAGMALDAASSGVECGGVTNALRVRASAGDSPCERRGL